MEGRGRGGNRGNPGRRGPFPLRGPNHTLTGTAPTKSRREEAIEHSYRKMMRKLGSRGNGPNQTTQPTLPPSPQIIPPGVTSIAPKLSYDRRTQPTTTRATWRKPAYHDRNKGNRQPWKSDSPNFDRLGGPTKRMLPNRNNATEAKTNESDEEHDEDEGAQDKDNKKRKLSQFQRAKRDMDMKKQEERRKAFERKKFEEERAVALKERKQKRIQRNKFVNQKNGKVRLTGQIQMILDKLQSESSRT